MTVSNPPQSRGPVEAVSEANSPPTTRREESPRDSSAQPTEASDTISGSSGLTSGSGRVSSPTATTASTSEATTTANATETSDANNEIVAEGSEPQPDPEALIAAFPLAKLQV